MATVDFNRLDVAINYNGSNWCRAFIKIVMHSQENDYMNLEDAMNDLLSIGVLTEEKLRENYCFPVFDEADHPGISISTIVEFTAKEKSQLLLSAAQRIDELTRNYA